MPRAKPKCKRQTCDPAVAGGISHAQPERDARRALEQILRAEAAGSGRVVIRYERVTTAPLDAENFAGSTKALTDCLRSAFPDLIADDSPEFVEIIHIQRRCARKDEEGTWVEVWG